MEKAQNGLFLIFFLIKNEKLRGRNRSHPEFCGDPKLKKCRTKAVLNLLPCPAFRLIKKDLPQNLNRNCQQRRCRHLAADRCHRLQSPRQETAR